MVYTRHMDLLPMHGNAHHMDLGRSIIEHSKVLIPMGGVRERV